MTEPERLIWHAAGSGALVDLRAHDAELDDPSRGATWDGVRTVRAEVLAELLMGLRTPPGSGRARAVRLQGARITGQLNLEAATLGCPLDLEDCHFERPIILREADAPVIRLPSCHVPGLVASQLKTRGDLVLSRGFSATGGVNLLGAHIGRSLSFVGATLTNPNGLALNGELLTVDGPMFCRDGFSATGEVNLLDAHISGALDLHEATLTNPEGLALDLTRGRAGTLYLLPRERPDGIVDLTDARVGVFVDDQASWSERLRLRGFVYDTLANDRVPVRARLGWLRRHQGGYAPQVYEQLAATYRRDGRDEAARRVLIAKQWRRRGRLNPWNWLLYATVGYGYRTWLAGFWLLVLLWAGTNALDDAYREQLLEPAKDKPTQQPTFHPLTYALDLLLPIVNLGQEGAWIPRGRAERWTWGLIVAGWLLTTVVVAGLTGVLKRD